MDYQYRDGRNPYGSRGGYVSSDRRMRDRARGRRDYARRSDYARRGDYARGRRDYGDYAENEGQTYREPCVRYSNSAYGVPVSPAEDEARYDRARYDSANRYDRAHYDGAEYRPIEIMGRFGGYYSMDESDYRRGDYNRYDYNRYNDYGGYGMDYAENDDLKYYEKKLLSQLDEKQKMMLKKEEVIKKAEQNNVRFEDYDEEEFYIVVLMMATDFGKTLGSSSPDTYIKMAKNWLEDDDASLKYSDKLYEYLDRIVDGR